MAGYSAVRDAGKTLSSLIWNNMKNDKQITLIISSENQIALSSPEEMTPDKKLSLFLYQIVEDSYQKNQENLPSSPEEMKYPPIYLNLFYMITPNTADYETDHLLMGKVAQIFNNNRILRGPVLRGELAGEELRLNFCSLSLDELNKMWCVVSKSNPYRLSAYYEVGPVKIDSTRKIGVKRVLEADFEKYLHSGEER
jgi:hypothetical protein